MTFFQCVCLRVAWFDEYLPDVVNDTLRAETGRVWAGSTIEARAVALIEAYGLMGAASFLAVELHEECGCHASESKVSE